MLEFRSIKISAPGKKICFWGAPAQFDPSAEWRENLARTGANTGNLFIGNGLFQNLDCAEKKYGLSFTTSDPTRLHERFDTIFVPASNFLNSSSDFSEAYDFLSKTKLPIFCFGLGSQHLPDRQLVLKPGTEKFIRLLSERGGSIGVRGLFTAELLNSMGINNISVVGCPSLLNMSTAAANRLQTAKPSLEKMGVHFSNNVRSHAINPAALRETENALFARAMAENSYYIIQNEIEEFQLASAANSGNEVEVERIIGALSKVFGVDQVNQTLSDFLRHRIRYFFSVDRWIGSMTTMTSCIGSRFHGTVGAILAGTPSFLLAHDMRTAEMADFFKIPSVTVDRNYNQEELMDRLLQVDFSPFIARLEAVHVEWTYFARANGLDAVKSI
jgi:polysaccharide pyruvyl transferase WcaK-like protein